MLVGKFLPGLHVVLSEGYIYIYIYILEFHKNEQLCCFNIIYLKKVQFEKQINLQDQIKRKNHHESWIGTDFETGCGGLLQDAHCDYGLTRRSKSWRTSLKPYDRYCVCVVKCASLHNSEILSPTQTDIYQMLYWHNWLSWWWAQGCSKHVENRNKSI